MKSKEYKFTWHFLDAKQKPGYSLLKTDIAPRPSSLLHVYKHVPKIHVKGQYLLIQTIA